MSSLRLATTLRFALALTALGCTGSDSKDDRPHPADAPQGNPDAPQGSCASLAGTWAMSGSCGVDLCTVAQTACALTQVSCNSGALSTTGSIAGNQYTYSGTTGNGIPSTCTGLVNGNTAMGTCTTAGLSCEVTANRL